MRGSAARPTGRQTSPPEWQRPTNYNVCGAAMFSLGGPLIMYPSYQAASRSRPSARSRRRPASTKRRIRGGWRRVIYPAQERSAWGDVAFNRCVRKRAASKAVALWTVKGREQSRRGLDVAAGAIRRQWGRRHGPGDLPGSCHRQWRRVGHHSTHCTADLFIRIGPRSIFALRDL